MNKALKQTKTNVAKEMPALTCLVDRIQLPGEWREGSALHRIPHVITRAVYGSVFRRLTLWRRGEGAGHGGFWVLQDILKANGQVVPPVNHRTNGRNDRN